jgi:hypothetical protein
MGIEREGERGKWWRREFEEEVEWFVAVEQLTGLVKESPDASHL